MACRAGAVILRLILMAKTPLLFALVSVAMPPYMANIK